MTTDRTLAWHFVAADPDWQHVGIMLDGWPVIIGETVTHEGPIEICRTGLHSSVRAIDALHHAPGPVACLVETWGIEGRHGDKIVARHRRVIAAADCTDAPRIAARMFALDVLPLWDAPEVVRQYLETGNETLREDASDAAWDAAMDAAVDAAVDAAWAAMAAAKAAWDAASAAAWDAAEAAAEAAAWDAAWDAARGSARAAQNALLESLLLDAIPGAREALEVWS